MCLRERERRSKTMRFKECSELQSSHLKMEGRTDRRRRGGEKRKKIRRRSKRCQQDERSSLLRGWRAKSKVVTNKRNQLKELSLTSTGLLCWESNFSGHESSGCFNKNTWWCTYWRKLVYASYLKHTIKQTILVVTVCIDFQCAISE